MRKMVLYRTWQLINHQRQCTRCLQLKKLIFGPHFKLHYFIAIVGNIYFEECTERKSSFLENFIAYDLLIAIFYNNEAKNDTK